MKAIINKIIHSSVVDGPGNRAAIFFQGCNYHCYYCHNPETISLCVNCGQCVKNCPAHALSMENGRVVWREELCCQCDLCIHQCPNLASPRVKEYTPKEVLEELKGDIPYIRGITVSGGECSLRRDFVAELFRLAREKGLTTLMDSNGSYDYTADDELMQVCDGVMLDVKAWDTDAHRKLTGVGSEKVLKNAVLLAKCGKLEEVRTVIVPDLLPNEETVRETSRLLAPWLSVRPIRYKVIAYRPFGVRSPYKEELVSPGKEELERLKNIICENGFTDVVVI